MSNLKRLDDKLWTCRQGPEHSVEETRRHHRPPEGRRKEVVVLEWSAEKGWLSTGLHDGPARRWFHFHTRTRLARELQVLAVRSKAADPGRPPLKLWALQHV